MAGAPPQNQLVDVAFEQPLYESTKGLIGLMFQQVGKISDLIRDPSFNPSDGRLELMVHHVISSFIVDIEEQQQLRKEMDALIKEYANKYEDADSKGIAKNRACLEFSGVVIAKLHDLLGTTRKNRVGFTWNPEECKVVDFR